MRRYESVVIINPDVSAEERDAIKAKLEEIIAQNGGEILKIDDWGIKRMAYLIRKKARGYYLLFDYCGMGPVVGEIERFCRISDKCLKYMTIVIDMNADPEKIKADIASERSKSSLSDAGPSPMEAADTAEEDEDMDEAIDEEHSEEVEE